MDNAFEDTGKLYTAMLMRNSIVKLDAADIKIMITYGTNPGMEWEFKKIFQQPMLSLRKKSLSKKKQTKGFNDDASPTVNPLIIKFQYAQPTPLKTSR
jgi:hypothetical protein